MRRWRDLVLVCYPHRSLAAGVSATRGLRAFPGDVENIDAYRFFLSNNASVKYGGGLDLDAKNATMSMSLTGIL